MHFVSITMPSQRHHFDQLDLLASDVGSGVMPPASDAVRDFLALTSVKGLGRYSLGALYDAFRPLSTVWTAPSTDVERILHTAKNRQAKAVAHLLANDAQDLLENADRFYQTLAAIKVTILFRDEPSYPARLREANGPRWLYVHGSVGALSRTATVAVVGTREPSEAGLGLAREAARVLTDGGFAVVSGLAQGIDSEAHSTVLDHGGTAIAVLGNGLNVEFPAGSRELRQRIVRGGGAVVTEYFWNDLYSRQSFVERNRIQAALSGAVLPVECKRKSGTAHTIRFADELNRKLFGVALDGALSPESDVYSVLLGLGAPIFDLGSRDGLDALETYLAPIGADRQPPSGDGLTLWSRAYRDALVRLRDVVDRRRPDQIERDWVLERVNALLEPEGRT